MINPEETSVRRDPQELAMDLERIRLAHFPQMFSAEGAVLEDACAFLKKLAEQQTVWILTDSQQYYPSFDLDFVSREQALEAFDEDFSTNNSEITLIEGAILRQKGGRHRA